MSNRIERKVFYVIMLVWLSYSIFITYLRYKSFDFKLMDQGTYYYIIEHLRHYGSWFDFSTDFSHRLGVHFSLILALFVPFQLLSSSPVTMQVVQLVLGSLGAYGVYLITLSVFKDVKDCYIRLIFPILYLGFYPFIRSVLFDFDVSRIAPTLIIFFIYFTLFNRKVGWSILFGILLCITRETLPLIIAGTGLYLFFVERNKRSGIIYFVAGIGVFITILLIIMPEFKSSVEYSSRFAGNSLVYLNSRYGYLSGNSSLEKVIFAFSHPLIVLKNFFVIPWFKWATFGGMYLFLLLMPLFDFKKNIIIIFIIGIYYLSNTDVTFIYKHQYFSELFPIVFISAITGFQKFRETKIGNNLGLQKVILVIQLLIVSAGIIQITVYYENKYVATVKLRDEMSCVVHDVLGINKMKDDEVAIFCHNRLFLYYDWKRYMTYYAYFDVAYDTYSQIPSIKRMYLVTVNEPELGVEVMKEYGSAVNAATQRGFKKVYQKGNFIAYEKDIK